MIPLDSRAPQVAEMPELSFAELSGGGGLSGIQ